MMFISLYVMPITDAQYSNVSATFLKVNETIFMAVISDLLVVVQAFST